MLSRVLDAEPPALPNNVEFSDDLKDFVNQCLTKDYRERPKYRQLLVSSIWSSIWLLRCVDCFRIKHHVNPRHVRVPSMPRSLVQAMVVLGTHYESAVLTGPKWDSFLFFLMAPSQLWSNTLVNSLLGLGPGFPGSIPSSGKKLCLSQPPSQIPRTPTIDVLVFRSLACTGFFRFRYWNPFPFSKTEHANAPNVFPSLTAVSAFTGAQVYQTLWEHRDRHCGMV